MINQIRQYQSIHDRMLDDACDKFRKALQGSSAFCVAGKIEKKGKTLYVKIHMEAEEMRRLDQIFEEGNSQHADGKRV